MSYNQKPPGNGNSGMGGAGPPNGPNNPQVAKSLAGFQQQMPNYQSPQADLNALIQQQRIQNIFKQQQQHIFQQHFQQQMQQQQQQHQQQQQYKDRGSSEPLALTRTPAAAELLNKTYQQHHQQHANGNPAAANPTLNQLQQQLQVLQPNLMQQIQAFQLMQQHQQQQQQQHHAQTQQAHQPSPPPPPSSSSSNPLQNLPQQQLHGQKTQQPSAALTPAAVATALQFQQRYITAAAAQATNANKVGAHSANPPTPPPLTATNQIKPPNLPPSTQITPVPSNSGISGTQSSTKPMSSNIGATTSSASPSKQIAPSISLLPTKPPNITPALPVAAHQQNKFNANKNQASTVGSTATPTPAHNQKPIIASDATSHAATIGNALQTTSESQTKSQNTNAEYSASTIKPISKGGGTPTKSVISAAAIAATAADSSNKSSITPLMPTNTSAIGTLPPSSGNANIAHSIKPIESRDVIAVQKGEAESLKKVSIDKTPAVEPKDSAASSSLTKSNANVLVRKTSATLEKPNAGSEKPANKCVALNPSDSVAATPVVPSNANEKPKVQSLTAAAAKAANNNVTEKKEEQNEKNEIPCNTEKPEKTTEKALSKEVAAKKQKLEEEKPINKFKKDDETAAETEKNVTTTEVENATSTKQAQNSPAIKKSNDDSKASCDDRNKKKIYENKNIIKEPNLEQTKDQLRVEKHKEDEIIKVEQTKTAKENCKVDSKDIKEAMESMESIEVIKAALVVASPTKDEDPPQVNAENIAIKKPQRQQKSNKNNVFMVSTSSMADDEKTNAKAEKFDNVEKATSSRAAAREEKRKKEKSIAETTITPLTPVASTPKTPKQESNGTNSDRKSQRHRLKTILYQSPLPELAFITKLSASEASNSPKPMTGEDKLIVFYKNEYMAVRNAEGTFYLCQTMQNVYRTSPKISIRWLSEDAKDSSLYIPDFYDHTDIECVLTTVELKRIDKGHLRLPATEKARIENILKKAIDVEKGLVPRPELTEENPDGLDLSLYKDESQIEKKVAGSQTPVSSARNSKRNTIANAAKSTPKNSKTAATKKRKSENAAATGGSASKKSKSSAKKRKTIVKREINRGSTSDDDNESSEDNASDAEYRPSQKKASGSLIAKSSPRMQRSPLAKARVASPVASSSRNRNAAAAKALPSLLTPSRSERATKRKASGVDTYTEFSTPSTKKTSSATDATSTPTTIISDKSKSKETQESYTASNKKTTSEAITTASISSVINNAESENSIGNSASSRPTRSRK